MKNAKYKLIKLLFGLFVIFLSLRTVLELEENKSNLIKYVNKYETDINNNWTMLRKFITENYSEAKGFSVLEFKFNFDNLRGNANEIIITSALMTFVGGILMIYGYSVASAFVLFGFVIEFIFLHNYYFFKEEKMKVNVLKLIAVFGGLMHWQ